MDDRKSPSELSAASRFQRGAGVIRWVVGASQLHPKGSRQRALLLSWLLLALLPTCLVALAVAWLDQTADATIRWGYLALIGGTIGILSLALKLNRAGRFSAAARLTVAVSIIGPWGSAALDPTIFHGNFVPLAYTVLAVMLSSMLLSAYATVAVAVAELSALGCLAIALPQTSSINWPSLLMFVSFVSLLSVVANVVDRNNMAQINEQQRQLRSSEAQLRALSVRDPLTGLFNRRYLEETLERELHRATRENHAFSVVLLDVDHLKTVNDRHGHAAGDELLRRIGRVLGEQTRRGDVACRYGGDEFVLILPHSTPEETENKVAQLRDAAATLSTDTADGEVKPVSLSFGIAHFPRHGASGRALLASADSALYRAKREGRGLLRVAD